MQHLTDDELFSIVTDESSPAPVPHLKECETCSVRFTVMKGALAVVDSWSIEEHMKLLLEAEAPTSVDEPDQEGSVGAIPPDSLTEAAVGDPTGTWHRRRTADCLLPERLVLALREGFSAEEMAHVGDCVACQGMVARQWRAECPSRVILAQHLSGPSPHRYALQQHLRECATCRERLDSPLVRALASRESALFLFALLPALVGRFDDAEESLPFLAEYREGDLSIALQERGGRLMGIIETGDSSRSGQRIRIELLDANGNVLEQQECHLTGGLYGCVTSLDLGSFSDRVRELGSECAFIVTILK